MAIGFEKQNYQVYNEEKLDSDDELLEAYYGDKKIRVINNKILLVDENEDEKNQNEINNKNIINFIKLRNKDEAENVYYYIKDYVELMGLFLLEKSQLYDFLMLCGVEND